MPLQLSGAAHVKCLSEDEKRKLTHVEMAAYAHLFAYVEEFIAPKMSTLAKDFELEERTTFDALTNFAAEEVKHMMLFRRIRDQVDGEIGVSCIHRAGRPWLAVTRAYPRPTERRLPISRSGAAAACRSQHHSQAWAKDHR